MSPARGGATQRRATRTILAAVVGLAIAAATDARIAQAAPTEAPAPSPSELLAARELFGQAIADEKRGDHAGALDKLRRVATVKSTPSVHFHLAYCLEHLGQLVLALGEYDAAEREATRERNDDVLRLVRATAPALRARVPTLSLQVDPHPPGTVVRLDGRPLAPGVLGIPVPVDPGSHVVEAEAEGHAPASARVELAERDAVARVLHLVPAPSSAPGAPRGVALRGGADLRSAPRGPAPGAPAGTTRSLAAPVVATAGAIVFAGAGVGFLLAASARSGSAAAACAERVTCDDLRGGVRTLDALALGSFVAAAGVSALAVVLFARSSDRADVASLHVSPGGLAGTF